MGGDGPSRELGDYPGRAGYMDMKVACVRLTSTVHCCCLRLCPARGEGGGGRGEGGGGIGSWRARDDGNCALKPRSRKTGCLGLGQCCVLCAYDSKDGIVFCVATAFSQGRAKCVRGAKSCKRASTRYPVPVNAHGTGSNSKLDSARGPDVEAVMTTAAELVTGTDYRCIDGKH